MRKNKNKKDATTAITNKRGANEKQTRQLTKTFLDMIAPNTIKFFRDQYICGSTYRCVWALREYPTSTEETALLQHLGEKAGVTLHIYTRAVTPADERKILMNADKANKLRRSNTENIRDVVEAESNLQDVTTVVALAHRNKEPFLHVAVYIELIADSADKLQQLQDDVRSELNAAKLDVDHLLLQQREGFRAVMPSGMNVFGAQFERVLPATSLANLYPFAYSGKTDPHGFYLGRDKYGSNIIVDLDRRAEDKTNANVLILGNSGQGKSHLFKLLAINCLESGKAVILLDPEMEYKELTELLGGCYDDLMSGDYSINVLQPKRWSVDDGEEEDPAAPVAFRKGSTLSQHISFLRDFFRRYKHFSDAEIDTIEIMLGRLYERFGMSDSSDLQTFKNEDYPILADLYDLILDELTHFDASKKPLYTEDQLRTICLGLHSMCKGSDSKFFNGYTNVSSDRFVTFGVKGLMEVSQNLRDALLLNVLSYMSGELLTRGNTVGGVEELHVFLSNPIAIEYIRNAMKRVRKRDSSLILASQNIEDFLIPGVAELTKPLFSIPTHQFLFHPGSIAKGAYMDALQLEENEYELIRACRNGICLYKCGEERYNLVVQPPEYKLRYYGKGGGR